jgi:2-amino-4-hydroxy-6-hydroxymethyldihydropteridine diphosphokinase
MIVVALGSNMGDRANFLERAVAALKEEGIRVTAQSSVIEVKAELLPNAPEDWDRPFLNQVVLIETALAPLALLRLFKAIEMRLGRKARGRWGPREIDLDLIAYRDLLLTDDELTLPHPLYHERSFVLQPLAEIAPQFRCPRTGASIGDMLARLA